MRDCPYNFGKMFVDVVVYLINRGPSSSLDGGIPEEAWIGKKVNYSFRRTFGCEAFFHIDKDNITKLEEKSKKYTFIGYGVNDFGYHLYDYETIKSLGVEMWYSIRSPCTNINCRERNGKKKTHNTQCLMRSQQMKFKRCRKIKMINNNNNKYLKLPQVLLEDLLG